MTDALWDVLRVGERSADRHKRRVIEAMKQGASGLLTQAGDLVTGNGGKIVKVRINVLETPMFAFDYHDSPQVGIGDAQPGDVIDTEIEDEEEGDGKEGGKGNGGGRSYEVELSLDDVIELLMDAWNLPNLEPKKKAEIRSEDWTNSDISRKGPMSRVHKRRTMKEAIKRAAASGGSVVIHNDDLRYRAPRETVSYSSNAVIVLARDRSGSMGHFEMKVSRITAIWLVQFLRKRYDRVEIRFVLHDDVANEVDESTFYHVRSGGGTQIAQAYRLVRKILNEYPVTEYNRYAVHFSDGGDWNMEESLLELKEILPLVQTFCYFEVNGWEGANFSMFWKAMQGFGFQDDPKVVMAGINDEDDVADALRAFLGREE